MTYLCKRCKWVDKKQIIIELSKGMTLREGDIISTGTPKGVGMGHKRPIFLKAGDTMEISISGLDTLSNKVI